jgi:hypothetical protein
MLQYLIFFAAGYSQGMLKRQPELTFCIQDLPSKENMPGTEQR